MSTASATEESAPEGVDTATLRRLALQPVETASFWTAITLPLAYPALLFGGLDGRGLLLLAAALVLHAAALLLGRGHNRDRA